MPLIDRFRYRPEIDGLRAVAVVVVCLFHADFGCPGGYVGVDVFFVISGFLITSLIWKDLESGEFTFAHFWERRARRIVPALVTVAIATLVAGWYFLLPVDFKKLGQAAVALAVFGANIYYWKDSGYFGGTADEKPLLHTWSLAVEEQYYLVMPFLLWGIFRIAALRHRKAVIAILLTIFSVSLIMSTIGVKRVSAATFYVLPTRAWELLLGALVAFLPSSSPALHRRTYCEIASVGGVILILAPVFLYSTDTLFPGLAALPPCLGTALIIWANSSHRTVVGVLLSTRPIIFIGLISYSLYLWHWPFLAVSRAVALGPLPAGDRAQMLVLGTICAVLSWRYVETPFRTRKLAASRRAMFVAAGAGLAAVCGGGLVCMFKPELLPRVSTHTFVDGELELAFMNEMTAADIRSERLISIGASDSTRPVTVLVWGDSHAMAAMPAIDSFLIEHDHSGQAATRSATAPVLGWQSHDDGDSLAFNSAVFEHIKRHRISHVIMVARWGHYINSDTAKIFQTRLLTTIRDLVELGAQPWILLDVPNHTFDVPKALSNPNKYYIASLCATPMAVDELEVNDPELFVKIRAAGGRIIDPKPRFLDLAGRRYLIEVNGMALYSDEHHLTPKGAMLMLLPLFRESFVLE